MYHLYVASTLTLLDVTNDLALAHEWAERSSRFGYRIDIHWHTKLIASYEHGARIEEAGSGRVAA